MATPRSANERIRRKIRGKKIGKQDSDYAGRIQVKKTGNNDPRRNRGMAEEFLKFYRGNEIDDLGRFSFLIEKMIDLAIDNAGAGNFPFKLSRLQEMKESIGN